MRTLRLQRQFDAVLVHDAVAYMTTRADLAALVAATAFAHTRPGGAALFAPFLAELREAREPPSRNGRRLNLLYGTQVTVRPPRFRFFVNEPGLDHPRLRLLGREPAP